MPVASINVIVQAITEASDQMNRNSRNIQELITISTSVEEKIHTTVDTMRKAAAMADQNVAGFRRTGMLVGEMTGQVEKINGFVTVNARNVEEIAGAAANLDKMADKLSGQMKRFKI